MSIVRLDITHLRNISNERFAFHLTRNIFFGGNGAGKTSVLEAIYLLTTARSFKTRELSSLISNDFSSLELFGKTIDENTVCIQKTRSATFVRFNHTPCLRSSALALMMPCQVFYQDMFEIINAGPSVRRTILDWGLFHVKPSHGSLLKDCRRILKQRNILLRQKAPLSNLLPWNKQLVDVSEKLHEYRREYVSAWAEQFSKTLPLLTNIACTLDYQKGWDKKNSGASLETILLEQYDLDVFRQYTHSGAHQADLIFNMDNLNAKQHLSRGQQKLILIAIKLAQAALLEKECIFLFDDITSELDKPHLHRLFALLDTIPGQQFFTTTDPELFNDYRNNADFFSLKDGIAIKEEVSRETSSC